MWLLFEENSYFRQVEICDPEAEKPMSSYGLYQIAMTDNRVLINEVNPGSK